MIRLDGACAMLLLSGALVAGGAGRAADLTHIESFDTDNAGWGLLEIVAGDQQLYEAPWDGAEQLIWDYLGDEPVQLYLFADAQSSGGRLVGDYAAAGVRSILFDLAFTNAESVYDLATYLRTSSGRQFEYPWELPEDDFWGTYETPMDDAAGWWRWDPVAGQWRNMAPSAVDLAQVVEVGVVLRTIDEPQAWDVFLDDFQLVGAERLPLATLGFVESFGRGNAGWLMFATDEEGGVETDAPWDMTLGALSASPDAGIDEVWLGADVWSSRGRLSGDFAAAGVKALLFDLRVVTPVAGSIEYSTYLRTGTDRHFEYDWGVVEDAAWWTHTTPLEGGEWARWDAAAQQWLPEGPTAADLVDVAETGVLLRVAGAPGAWSAELDNFELAPATAQPEITRFQAIGGGSVRIDWTAPGPVFVELTETLPGSTWQELAGPLSGTSWTGVLPGGLRCGFLRLRLE